MRDIVFYSLTAVACLLISGLTIWALSSDFTVQRQEYDLQKIMNDRPRGPTNKLAKIELEGFDEKDDSEPLSDRTNFREKKEKYTDEDLLLLTLSRSSTPIEDEVYDMEFSDIMSTAAAGSGECLDDAILNKQKTRGKNAYSNTRVSFDDIREDYLLDTLEDNEPWWLSED